MPALSVGNVTTLPAGSTPVAKIVSTSNGYALVLALPEGYVPKKGTDYWTDADQQAIKDEVTKIIGDAKAEAKTEIEKALTTADSTRWARLDLTGEQYDPNKWYPVTSSTAEITSLTKIIVKGELYTDYAKWGTHTTTNDNGLHGFAFFKQIKMNHNGWGASNINAYLEANNHTFDDGKCPAYFDQVVDKSCYLVWLRGGATYALGISIPQKSWTVHTEGWKTAYKTYSPVSDEPSDLMSLISALKQTGQKLNFVDFTTLGSDIQIFKNKLGVS